MSKSVLMLVYVYLVFIINIRFVIEDRHQSNIMADHLFPKRRRDSASVYSEENNENMHVQSIPLSNVINDIILLQALLLKILMIYVNDVIQIYLTSVDSVDNNNADDCCLIGSLRSNSSIGIGDDGEHIDSIPLSDITNGIYDI